MTADEITQLVKAARAADAQRVEIKPDGSVVIDFAPPLQVGPVFPGAVFRGLEPLQYEPTPSIGPYISWPAEGNGTDSPIQTWTSVSGQS